MYPKLKRVLDFILSLLALFGLSWLFLLISLAVKLDSHGPVLFRQKRIGKNHTEFWMYKFRTMQTDTPKEVPTHLLQDPEKHITRVGRFLRKTSLDELPQLLNILAGHMSIVGPRPALRNQTDLLQLRDENEAGTLRPGLTGWAQVNGRDELATEVKAAYDGEYVRKMSLIFDLKCILLTVVKVIKQEGIAEGAAPTAPHKY